LETATEKLLHIVIAGQPELTGILQRPDLRQFKQRVNCLCKLQPLSFPELKEYIYHRLAQAGAPQQTLFSDAVIQRIHDYSGGIPRLVNSLCDNALRTGMTIHSPRITLAIIDESAVELDLVPPKPSEPPKEPESAAVPVTQATAHTNGHAAFAGMESKSNTNGSHHHETRIPLESYASRQKSLTFFGQLMDRWR